MDAEERLILDMAEVTKYEMTNWTSIPWGFNSPAKAEDQACKKDFEPEYVAKYGVGNNPPNEPMVKIKPLTFLFSLATVSAITGATAWVIFKVTVLLMVMMSLYSFSWVSKNGTGMEWDWPTLLTNTVTGKLDTVCKILA